MIAGAGIEDQELAIITEGTSVNDPAVARRGDLRAGTGRERQALLGAPGTVRRAKFLDSDAVDRQRKLALGGRERDRRRQPARIIKRSQIRPVGGLVLAGARAAEGCILALLEPGDEIDKAVGLARKRGRALPLRVERLLGLRLLLLALL